MALRVAGERRTVLVNGAAGGVGTVALLKVCHVPGAGPIDVVSSDEKRGGPRAGADEVGA